MRSLGNLVAALVVSITVSACETSAPEPPVLGEVPSFQLVGDDGQPFDSSSLEGKSWLASFLFTSCPGPCPKLVERLKLVRKKIPAKDLAFVSISVDPKTDQPPVLADYKTKRGIAPADAWTFVTGDEEQVLTLVRRGFRVGVEKSANPDGEEGAVVHGVRVALIDGKRRIRGLYDTNSDEDLAKLERDVAGLR